MAHEDPPILDQEKGGGGKQKRRPAEKEGFPLFPYPLFLHERKKIADRFDKREKGKGEGERFLKMKGSDLLHQLASIWKRGEGGPAIEKEKEEEVKRGLDHLLLDRDRRGRLLFPRQRKKGPIEMSLERKGAGGGRKGGDQIGEKVYAVGGGHRGKGGEGLQKKRREEKKTGRLG